MRPDLSYASGYVNRYLDKQTKQDIVNQTGHCKRKANIKIC